MQHNLHKNIHGETKARPIFIPRNVSNGKKVTLQLMDELYTKS